MDWRAIIAAVPFLRRLWRWLPGPLRVVVVVVAVVIAISRMLRGDTPDDEVPATRDDRPSDDPSS